MKTESLIELIFDEMGANKSMIFRVQLDQSFLSEKELLYKQLASEIGSYSDLFEDEVQSLVITLTKTLEQLKAVERQSLGEELVSLLNRFECKVENELSKNNLLDLKVFQQSLQQLKHKFSLVKVDLSKISYSQNFDAMELSKKLEFAYSSFRTLARIILQQIKTYENFKFFLNKEVFLFCQVSMLDKDLKNFDVAYSYENIDSDNFAFLNSEVYRLIKNKVIPDFKEKLDQIKTEYEQFFVSLKENDLYYFLNKLEVINLKKDSLLRNDFLYFLLSTGYYLELINKFKEAEKKVYKRVFQLIPLIVKMQPLNLQLKRPLSDSELMILILSNVLKMNFVEFMMLTEEDFNFKINHIIRDLFKGEIPYGKSLTEIVIPYKLFKTIKKDQNLKIWDFWRHEFVIKNFKGRVDESRRFILTGNEIIRKKETLQEAIFIHLAEEHILNFKECSRQVILERSDMVVTQGNMTIEPNLENSFKISVQFSFILEKSIIVASNLKFN